MILDSNDFIEINPIFVSVLYNFFKKILSNHYFRACTGVTSTIELKTYDFIEILSHLIKNND